MVIQGQAYNQLGKILIIKYCQDQKCYWSVHKTSITLCTVYTTKQQTYEYGHVTIIKMPLERHNMSIVTSVINSYTCKPYRGDHNGVLK